MTQVILTVLEILAAILSLGLLGVLVTASYVSLSMLRRDGDGDAELVGRTLAYCAFILATLVWIFLSLGGTK